MKAKAVSARRRKRRLPPTGRGAELPVVGRTPPATDGRKSGTMKTFILRRPQPVEPQKLWWLERGERLTRFLNGRDSALRCPRPERSGGRNACQNARLGPPFPAPDAALGDGDGAARHPYRGQCQAAPIDPARLCIQNRQSTKQFRCLSDTGFTRMHFGRAQFFAIKRAEPGGEMLFH
jgi:hypothetical protein